MVTEEELNQYRQIMLANQNSVNRNIHRVNLLLLVTKTNRNNINSNSNRSDQDTTQNYWLKKASPAAPVLDYSSSLFYVLVIP